MELLGELKPDAMEDVFLQDDLLPSIAEHAKQCNEHFRKALTIPNIVPDPTMIDDQVARFLLWISNMDVYGPANVSLDYRLRYSPTVVDIIHQLLGLILDTLISLKSADERPPAPSRKRQRISKGDYAGAGARPGDTTSDSEDDEPEAEENASKIAFTIGGSVTRLFRLSNAIRKSATVQRAHKMRNYKDDKGMNEAVAELRTYTDCYIRFRFPEAPELFRSSLVNANALRLQRLYYQSSHRRRIGLTAQQPSAKAVPILLPSAAPNVPVIKFAPDAARPVDFAPPVSRAPAPITTATTARQTAIELMYAKPSTLAPRAKSVAVNNNLSFPPVPPTSECPYCGVIIEFKGAAKTSVWRDHVLKDLEPYLCIYKECMHSDSESTTFETSRSWTNHLQNAHGCTWECRAPSHAPLTFDQESQFKDHSHTEHGVPTRHVDTLSNAARKPVVEKVLECPFGDDFHFEGPLESSSVFSSDALQLHVAAHLKEIALLALQKIPDEAEQSGINLASDQQSEDDGLGVAHVRGSMYSVLDDENLDPENEAQEEMMDHNADTITPSVERLDLEDRDPNHQWKFHEAARTGNISAIRSLMVHGDGFIMDRPDATGLTPYLWAVLAGHAHVAEVLLDRGVEVDSTGGSSKSALGWAANVGHASVAELLVRKGSSLDLVSRDLHRAPLAEAAACGNPGLTEMLLTTDGVDPDQKDKDGWSAVHLAAEQSHFEVVRMLLATGRVDVNAVSSYGTSSLHCAANGGNIDIVRLLLDHGADPLKTTCHGWTPVHHACFLGHSNIVQLLLEDVRVRSSLPSVDNHGWSVLHLAAYSRDQATLETLLQVYDLTSSLDVCDESGLTAADWLDLAPMSHSYKATSNLAFTKSRCCRAVTGLRQAVVEGNVSMVELLLDQGCSINGTDSGGRTALYHAVRKAHTSIMSLLLAKGADPNVLPAGRRNWEGCVTDDILLMRLKQSGYHNSSTDRDVDSQMRMRLRRQCGVVNGPDTVMEDTTVRVRRTTELSTASSVKPAPPSSFRSKLWKRIRGQ